jgi:hypothetical protein
LWRKSHPAYPRGRQDVRHCGHSGLKGAPAAAQRGRRGRRNDPELCLREYFRVKKSCTRRWCPWVDRRHAAIAIADSRAIFSRRRSGCRRSCRGGFPRRGIRALRA